MLRSPLTRYDKDGEDEASETTPYLLTRVPWKCQGHTMRPTGPEGHKMKKFPTMAQLRKRSKSEWLLVIQTAYPAPIGRGVNPLAAILDCARKSTNVDWKQWLAELDDEAKEVIGGMDLVASLEAARAGITPSLSAQAQRVAELTAKATGLVLSGMASPDGAKEMVADATQSIVDGDEDGPAKVRRQIAETRERQAKDKQVREAGNESDAETEPAPPARVAEFDDIVGGCDALVPLAGDLAACSEAGKVCSRRTCPRAGKVAKA